MNTALGRTELAYLTNKSGGDVAKGDVVIVDSANASAFTTTTTSAYTSGRVGVIWEPNGIVNNASGLVAFSGYVPQVNLSGSASLGDIFKTHSVAKQAVRHAAPIIAGDFGQVLGTGTTPAALLFGSLALGGGDAFGPSSSVLGDLAYFSDTTGKTLAAGSPPDGFMLNGKLSVTVGSNNLTVALKTISGGDPSASDPVTVWINGTARQCTAALAVTANAGTNWCNSGGAALATKEADYFAYLVWNTTPATDIVDIGFSRIPWARVYSEFSGTSTNETYLKSANGSAPTSTDDVVVIGRFAATLSAGAGYTWTVPTFTSKNLIQRPIYETRLLVYAMTVTSQTGTITTVGATVGRYQVIGRNMLWAQSITITDNGTGATTLQASIPFTPNTETTALTGTGLNASTGVFTQAFYASGPIVKWATAAFAYPLVSTQQLVGNGIFALTVA